MPAFTFQSSATYDTPRTSDFTLQDNINLKFGTGGDATIDYNGTDLIISPQVVGTGSLIITGGSNAQTVRIETTGAGVGSVLQLAVPASGTGDPNLSFIQGDGSGDANNMQYNIVYDSSSNFLRLTSRDGDGASGTLDIWRIPDGQTTIDANTTWDDNVFDDYDDALVLSPRREGKIDLKARREQLIEIGVLKLYDDGFVGYNDQRMAALLAGGIYQSRQRIDELEAKLAALETRLPAP